MDPPCPPVTTLINAGELSLAFTQTGLGTVIVQQGLCGHVMRFVALKS